MEVYVAYDAHTKLLYQFAAHESQESSRVSSDLNVTEVINIT